MSLDTIARGAGAEVRRAADRRQPMLPDAYEIVRRGDRRRTRALWVLCVVSLVLAGVALLRDGGGDTGLATTPPSVTAALPGDTDVAGAHISGRATVFPCAAGELCGGAPADVGVIFYRSGAYDDDAADAPDGVMVSAVAGDDGRFAEDLAPGRWEVFVADIGPLDCTPTTLVVEAGVDYLLDVTCRPVDT